MSSLFNGSNYRLRRIDPFYTFKWQDTTDFSIAGDEIIEAPENHLLTQDELFEAEGGHIGLSIRVASVLLGVGSLFAMNPRLYTYFRGGSMKFREWLTLGGVGFLSHQFGHYIATNYTGTPCKYYNHWIAYSYVKTCNRWEGRRILKKAPTYY